MGLLDSILGAVTGGRRQNQNYGQVALINAVIQMIANKGGGTGGLEGLVSTLAQGGLGNIVKSWVGTGQNIPVSGGQLQDALGSSGDGGGLLEQLARQSGLSHGETADQLSHILPGLVDELTPGGEIPAQESLDKMLGAYDIGT